MVSWSRVPLIINQDGVLKLQQFCGSAIKQSHYWKLNDLNSQVNKAHHFFKGNAQSPPFTTVLPHPSIIYDLEISASTMSTVATISHESCQGSIHNLEFTQVLLPTKPSSPDTHQVALAGGQNTDQHSTLLILMNLESL